MAVLTSDGPVEACVLHVEAERDLEGKLLSTVTVTLWMEAEDASSIASMVGRNVWLEVQDTSGQGVLHLADKGGEDETVDRG